MLPNVAPFTQAPSRDYIAIHSDLTATSHSSGLGSEIVLRLLRPLLGLLRLKGVGATRTCNYLAR
jgi:hypothetical protein